MKANIAVVKGDGIGPEIIDVAVKVINKIEQKYNHTFNLDFVDAGGIAIDKFGECLPKNTIDICKSSDAVLLGAVGGDKWNDQPGDNRPETALLRIRKELGVYANIRPATLYEELKEACPLKEKIIDKGFDISIVRELTGGIYFGNRGTKKTPNGICAYDVEKYSEVEVRRIAIKAFDAAMKRSKNLVSVDKANVLESSKLWRRVVEEVSVDYPEVSLSHMYIDNAAMQLIKDPSQFDVIVTSNMFGDILSDEASQITGSIGMLPSASLGDGKIGLYEPIHGSAPDIAGMGLANPMATVLSVAMMFRHSFGLNEEAEIIEKAVKKALAKGVCTGDLNIAKKPYSTSEVGDFIVDQIC
jgi:3-isopropylmalate dehydrogenase